MQIQVVDHPLALARLTTLRDKNTDRATFRAALADLATMLVYESTRDLALEKHEIETPLTPTTGLRLADAPLLVPILRAGLGMAEAAQSWLPEAQMGFVGLARDEVTHQPTRYLESVPESIGNRPVFILDPMLATGGSLLHTCEVLTSHGATDLTVVCVIASPEGIARVERSGLSLRIVTANVDERLNDDAFIVPGLGDAGDRQFGKV